MTYLTELRVNWRALVAATIGFGSALSVNGYIHSLMAPHLLAEFHWSKSQLALGGLIYILVMVSIPLAGRMADIFGVRAAATFGVVLYPLSWVGVSMMTGDIRVYYAIQILQLLLCATTTATVYCRVIAERFEGARGLALGVMACGPGVVALIGSPVLGHYIEGHGWRSGALVFALFSATAGAVAMLLMPSSKRSAQAARPRRSARKDYPLILRTPAFWILCISVFLCSLPFALTQTQLNVMLLDRHLSPAANASIISTFAAGAMAGRFFMGMALDRFPIYLVAAIGMALSGIGLFILAAPVTNVAILILGVGLFGLSFGAESDVMGYAVVRYFGLDIYSSVLGLLTGAVGGAMALGAIVLSLILKTTDSYSLFMLLAGTGVLLGSLNFLRLRGLAPVQSPAAENTAN